MRLAPLPGGVALLAAFAPAATAPASGFTRCPDEDTFVVAVYIAGVTCSHAYAVISRWRVDKCQHVASNCTVTYRYHDVGPRTYRCSSIARVDHMQRHYYAIACMTDNRNHDVRARDYPHGDYKPG